MRIQIGSAAALSVALIAAEGNTDLAADRYERACQFAQTFAEQIEIQSILSKQPHRMIPEYESTIKVSECSDDLAQEISITFLKILKGAPM